MQYNAIPCNTMQYNATPCNTMQYHASIITADGAYHCPVGSIMAIFPYSTLLSNCCTSALFQAALSRYFDETVTPYRFALPSLQPMSCKFCNWVKTQIKGLVAPAFLGEPLQTRRQLLPTSETPLLPSPPSPPLKVKLTWMC